MAVFLQTSNASQSCHRLSHRRRSLLSSFAHPDMKIKRHAAATVLAAAPGRYAHAHAHAGYAPLRCCAMQPKVGRRWLASGSGCVASPSIGSEGQWRCGPCQVRAGGTDRTHLRAPNPDPRSPPSVSSKLCPGTTHVTQPLVQSTRGGTQYLRICVPSGAGRAIVLIGPCSCPSEEAKTDRGEGPRVHAGRASTSTPRQTVTSGQGGGLEGQDKEL